MPSDRSSRSRSQFVGIVAVIATFAVATWAMTKGSLLRAEPADHPAGHGAHDHAGHAMTDADMKNWVTNWYASHPRVGTPSTGVPVDTFTVYDFGYSNDANPTDVDTANIFVGQTLLFKWVNGVAHTVTNGTGFMDPSAGVIFDQPSDNAHPEFAIQFSASGTVPFFCRPHEGTMKGWIKIGGPTDVVPISGGGERIGFASDPSPNPTRDLAAFRFALGAPGRARVEVFDVRGRRVGTPVDRVLGPGTYAAMWDGRSQDGERVTAGVYYLRLTIPGKRDSREVVVTR